MLFDSVVGKIDKLESAGQSWKVFMIENPYQLDFGYQAFQLVDFSNLIFELHVSRIQTY